MTSKYKQHYAIRTHYSLRLKPESFTASYFGGLFIFYSQCSSCDTVGLTKQQ